MGKRTSMNLSDEMLTLEDRALAQMEGVLPPERYRTDLYELALTNLIDTIKNHEEYEGDPDVQKAFRTRVVRPHYSIDRHVEVKRP